MALITAQGIRDLLDRSQNDDLPDLGTDEFLDFANWFNQEAYEHLWIANTEDFIVEQTINTVVDQNNYAITGDLDNIRPQEAGLFEEDKTESLPITGFNSRRKGSTYFLLLLIDIL